MMKSYIVRAPFVVRINERLIHKSGEVIALDEQTAQQHAHKLVEVVEVVEPAKGAKNVRGKS